MPWLVYTWDAENRLTYVGPGGYAEPPDGSLRVEFEYDYLGRRVSQVVESYDTGSGTWSPVAETKYIWAGWLMLMELDGLSSDAVLRRNTWGLDLAGQAGNVNSLEAAGGIGGLLAVDDLNGTPTYPFDDWECVFTYDANGNVAQLVAWETGYGGATGDEWHDDRLVAHYEYDPYGNVTNDLSGYAYAETNRWRFSTHQYDPATGLIYAKGRYYDAVLGRWLNRDPIGEAGGLNLCAYVENRTPNLIDPLGLAPPLGGSNPASLSQGICGEGWEPVTGDDGRTGVDGEPRYSAWHAVGENSRLDQLFNVRHLIKYERAKYYWTLASRLHEESMCGSKLDSQVVISFSKADTWEVGGAIGATFFKFVDVSFSGAVGGESSEGEQIGLNFSEGEACYIYKGYVMVEAVDIEWAFMPAWLSPHLGDVRKAQSSGIAKKERYTGKFKKLLCRQECCETKP